MTGYEALSLERRGHVAEIRYTRPELHNRFDDALRRDLIAALRTISDDADVRAILLTSTGPVFSAGGDFELMRAAHDDAAVRRKLFDDARELYGLLLDVPQPIVVAMHGHAIGAGATVALACDLVVGTRGATISDPHVRIGLVAGEGGTIWWPQSMGLARARRYLLTGDSLPAEKAYELGLIGELTEDPEQTRTLANELAQQIAALPPVAVRGTKRALNHVAKLRMDEVLDLALTLEEESMTTDDLLEAVAAFKEGRPGRFTGR